MTCVTFACADHFGPKVLIPLAGDLSVDSVPEPETVILLLGSFLLFAILFVAKARFFGAPPDRLISC